MPTITTSPPVQNCCALSVRRCGHIMSALMLSAVNLGVAAQDMDFDGALRAALDRAPLLQARGASVQGAQALQTSAAQLPDPKLTLGIDSLPVNGPNRGSVSRDDFTQRQIGWTQDVPNRAKRAARADAAQARTERERALLQMEQLTVRRETGLAWLASYFSGKRLALFDELIVQQELMKKTAPAQLAAGKINPSDISAIELDALALADRRDELQREAAQSRALLRRWAGDAASARGPAPEFTVDQPYLLATLERNPEIAVLTPIHAMADAEVREAEAARQGDWSWSVSYGKRGQGFGDLVSVLLTFELPLSPGQRQQPQIRARQQELLRIAAERDELVRRQTQELQALLAELGELDSKLQRLTQQALPLAAQRTDFTLAAYESGRDKLAAVLEARKQQTELGLRALELQARQRAVQWRLNSILPEQAP